MRPASASSARGSISTLLQMSTPRSVLSSPTTTRRTALKCADVGCVKLIGQLYVNGWQFGRRVANLGPQTIFPVPPVRPWQTDAL